MTLFNCHGGIPVFGIMVSHSWDALGAILHIVQKYNIDRFVEIGVHRGGLGALMHAYSLFNPEFDYLGIEIEPSIIQPIFLQKEPATIIGDALAESSINQLRDFAHSGSRALIYCDGGNKPAEFAAYSPALRPGDLIMVHDYPTEFNESHFENTPLERIEADTLLGCIQALFVRRT